MTTITATSTTPELAPLWLDHPRAQDVACTGGKAASLARLVAAGLRVPPGVVVPAAAYRQAVVPLRERIDALLAGLDAAGAAAEPSSGSPAAPDQTPARDEASPATPTDDAQAAAQAAALPAVTGAQGEALAATARAIQELVLALPMDPQLEAALALETAALLQQEVGGASVSPRDAGGAAGLLAVRSSATAEDLPGASFAGQYDTELGVAGAQVAGAVRRCWAGYWGARALAYRRERGLDHWADAMAVLVQRLVPAACAGVAFTAHPTVGWRHLLVVDAALGLGQGVVDGTVPADTYAVDRELRQVVLRDVKPKTHRIVPTPAGSGAGGTERVAVDAALAAAPALTDGQLLALLDAAAVAERLSGAPQDVEWAFAGAEGAAGVEGGELFVLQARPITALPPDPAERFPITWEDPQHRTLHWKLISPYGQPEKGRAIKPLGEEVWDYFDCSFKHAAFLTGRAKLGRRKALGVYRYWAEGKPLFPDEETRKVVRAEFDARVERYRAAGKCMYPEEQLAELESANARLYGYDRERATDAELADHLEEAGRVFVRHWTLHWYWWEGDWGGSAETKHERRWERVYQDLTGDRRKGASRRLLDGLPNRLTEAIDGVMNLAQIAQRHPRLRQALEEQTPAAFLEALRRRGKDALPGAARFAQALDRLLAEQPLRTGQGAGAETNPLTAPWVAQPELVLDTVRQYLPRDIVHLRRLRRATDRRRGALVAKARQRVGNEPDKLAAFDRAYAAACASAQWFEDHNYHIDSATQALHYLALTAVGRRLVAGGLLDALEDVLWLKVPEMTGALRAATAAGAGSEPASAQPAAPEAPAASPTLRSLVEERKADSARWEALTPPPWLGAPPPPKKPKTDEETAKEEREKKARERRVGGDSQRLLVQGQSGSRGLATGRVRIVPGEVPVPDLARGDVLVSHNAGPLWTPVFPALGAIVLEGGQSFQHAMLTAREYRVPAVFQAKDATKVLKEGQIVTVDGTRGLVLRPAQEGDGVQPATAAAEGTLQETGSQ